MKNVSSAFKNELKKGNRKYIKSLKLTLNDGTELLVDNSKLWQNGVKIGRSTSSSSSFDIGSVIIGQLTVTLSNINDDYSEYDFTDCVASDVKVGLELPVGTIESLTYGKFYLDEAKYNGSIITLSFYDSIYKFDKKYSESNLIYPATLGQIVRDACSVCGVTLQTTSFDHDDYVVQQRPNDESITFRQVLQWVGQIACLYCMADEQGRLCLQWYDTDLLESIDLSEDIPDNPTGYHHIHSFTSLSTGLDDVVITGISVTQDIESDDGTVQKTYQSGKDGYVLSISKNKLIQGDAGMTVASMLGEKIIGMRFRTFSASTLSDPTIEAGDIVVLTNRKGEKYKSIITSNVFQPGNFQSISCDAVTPARKSASRFSESTQAYVEYRKGLQKEKTEREKAIEELGNRINSSSGVFTTIEKQDDGSNIYYLHNKPSLSESDMIWKMTAEAWGVSTDGGKTYNAGMTVDGDTIVRILTATGVNADWIDTGEIQVSDDEGNTIFSVNIDTKQVFISGDSVRIGSKSATEAINEALEAAQNAGGINLQLDNDFQGISTDYEGNISGSFPECKTTAQVFYGQTDITNNCVFTTTKSASITGSWNNQTKTYTVTGLSADSGWVDITATYLTTISVTKRFGIEKIKGGVPGQDGQDGQPGRTFFIEPSATILKRTKDNAISPSQIRFSAYYRDGDSATRYSYSGRWIIDTTSNGSSYTEIYRSSSNESSVSRSLTGISSSVIQIRARLYASGGFTTMIDSQSVTIVNDVDSLTPLKVLELISQGMEGIYSPDGVHYYINASAIKSGQIQGIEIISESDNDWMKMSQSLLTGGYGSTTDGLLDLSANYSGGARKVVLESKTDDVVLKSAKEFRVQRQTGEMGYLVQSGGTDYFDEIHVEYGTTYEIVGVMYGEDFGGNEPYLDVRLADGNQKIIWSGRSGSSSSYYKIIGYEVHSFSTRQIEPNQQLTDSFTLRSDLRNSSYKYIAFTQGSNWCNMQIDSSPSASNGYVTTVRFVNTGTQTHSGSGRAVVIALKK